MCIFYKRKSMFSKYKVYYLFIFATIFVNIILGCSSSASKQTYDDTEFGTSLEIPDTWKLERDERMLLLSLTPIEISSDEDPVSITVLSAYDEGQELLTEFEDEVERVKRTNTLDEVQFVSLPKRISINNSETISATIIMPIQLNSETKLEAATSSQPMDLIVIRDNDQLIVVYVRKSDTNNFLNAQANDIVKSIRPIDEE